MPDPLDTLVGEIDANFDDEPTPVWRGRGARAPERIRLRFEADGYASDASIEADRFDEGVTIGRNGSPEVAEALRAMFFGPVSRVHALVRREGRALTVYPISSGSGIWRGGVPRERMSLLPGECVELTPPGSSPVYMRWLA